MTNPHLRSGPLRLTCIALTLHRWHQKGREALTTDLLGPCPSQLGSGVLALLGLASGLLSLTPLRTAEAALAPLYLALRRH